MPTRILAVASSASTPLTFCVVAVEYDGYLPPLIATLVRAELRGFASELASNAAAFGATTTEDMLSYVARHQKHDFAQNLRELDLALGLAGMLRAELVAVHSEVASQ